MRIGIVNDMPLAVESLRRALASRPDLQVIWIARDGGQAVQQCARETPDVVLMDLIMPVMDGVEATRRIMASTPCAILVTTADVKTNLGKVFAAMGHGALDAVNTPPLARDQAREGAVLLGKLDAIQRSLGLSAAVEPLTASKTEQRLADHLVAIGASAGGPAALASILESLPSQLPAAVVLVQHIDSCFAPGLAAWLSDRSKLPLKLAEEGDLLLPGRVFLADGTTHLVINARARLTYTNEPNGFYTPSVDAFFESVRRFWSGNATAVLLTGMGRDGAQGLKHLRDKGVHTIAQDQATSAVYGMPKAAAALNAAAEILPLEKIGPVLVRRVHSHSTESPRITKND